MPMKKKMTQISPSPTIVIHDSTYQLKAIVQHHGTTTNVGHYTTVVKLDNKMLQCDDGKITEKQTLNHSEGYIYTYEIMTPDQSAKLSLQGNIDGLNMPNDAINTNEGNITPTEKNSPVFKNKYVNRNAAKTTNKRVKPAKNILQEQKKIGTRSSPIKRKARNYKESKKSYNHSPSKRRKISRKIDFQPSPRNESATFDAFQKLLLIRQEKNMAQEKGDSNFNVFKDNPLIDAAKDMHDILMDLELSAACIVCNESWYDLEIGPRNKMCKRCSNENRNTKLDKDKQKILYFSKENDMHPTATPECIKKLTFIELASIKLVQPMFHIITTKGGGLKMKGHSIALEQDISDFVGSLPHSPDKLPMIILRSRNEANPKKFKANGKHILEALDWLKDNNEFYEKIPIDREAALQHYNPNHFIEGIPEEFVEDPINTDEPQNPTMINEDGDEINDILQQNFDIDNDIPPPESVVQQQFSRPTVLESMKNIANNVTIESNMEKMQILLITLKFFYQNSLKKELRNFLLLVFLLKLLLSCFQMEKEISQLLINMLKHLSY